MKSIKQRLFRDQLPPARYGVRIPVQERYISLLLNVQPGCAAHPASYSVRTRVLSQGKGVRGKVNHAPPSTAKVKNAWNYATTLSVFFHGVDREKFIVFTLNRMKKFLADKPVPEYLLRYHICEFRTHAYYIVPMKCKPAISSQKFTL